MTSGRLTAFFMHTLFGVAYCYGIQRQPPVQPCAEICSYNSEDTDWGPAVNVQCGERNLRSVPVSKHDKPVSLLNASHNVLRTLEEDALSSYESVRYLYLQHCKIVNINEKAFQRLENLTVIDLASNRLTSISTNLFNCTQKLDKLILRKNNLVSLQWNAPILNGPSSLSILDLQSCQLSNISSITFSLLPKLTFLDISRNNLVLMNNDTLTSHENLKDVNLENNPWQCGAMFEVLMCWMHSKLALSHNRTVQCQYRNERWDIWSLENRSSLCRPIKNKSMGEFVTVMPAELTTVSVGVSLSPETSLDTPRFVETAVRADLTTVSLGVPLSPKTSPHTPRVVETAVTTEAELGDLPENDTGSWASLLPWNVNTLMVFVILPITLGGSVFVSLIAVNYITKRRCVHCPQHHMQGEDNHLAACLDSTVPFLNPQLQADLKDQPLGYVHHVYEEIR